MLTAALIEQILTTIPGRTIGLLGDLFLDRYLEIESRLDEPSLETGLTAYQVTGIRNSPGALGTVINNLAALGTGRVIPITILGDDGHGDDLQRALKRLPCVDAGSLIVDADRFTPTYTKPMRDGVELNRLDVKNRTPTPAPLIAKVLKQLDRHWSRVDAWIVLDQVSEADCGVVTAAVREHVADRAKSDLKRFVLADSRERITEFRHVSIKPNRREFEQLGERSTETAPFIFATDGERGIDLQCRETPGERTHIPAYPVNGPTDIVGAGDSTSAGIVCAICSGMNAAQAAAFGNLVASITVQQIGTTGTATPQQVRDRWNTVMSSD